MDTGSIIVVRPRFIRTLIALTRQQQSWNRLLRQLSAESVAIRSQSHQKGRPAVRSRDERNPNSNPVGRRTRRFVSFHARDSAYVNGRLLARTHFLPKTGCFPALSIYRQGVHSWAGRTKSRNCEFLSPGDRSRPARILGSPYIYWCCRPT